MIGFLYLWLFVMAGEFAIHFAKQHDLVGMSISLLGMVFYVGAALFHSRVQAYRELDQ